MAAKVFARAILIFMIAACRLDALPDEIPVVLDPGHGGPPYPRKDDKWDPVTKQYLEAYLSGMIYQKWTEQEIVLDVSKKLKVILDLTRTDEGWNEFQKILRIFSDDTKFERVVFKTGMSRTDGWQTRFKSADTPEASAPYRMYDYPEPSSGKIQPGRISYINSLKPYLVVALHLNPADGTSPGGMGAVLSPGYPTFEILRKITLGQLPVQEYYKLPWAPSWLISDPGFSQFEAARADAWVYFHGYRMLRDGKTPWLAKNRGIRYNMVTWKYAEKAGWEKTARLQGPGPYAIKPAEFKAVGKFWDRERAQPELWRREGGPMGFGGDNHYASDELLRFIQMGIPAQVPERRKPGGMGPIVPPFVSTYALPTFTNAICAYLEIAHLNRDRDRTMVLGNQDELVKSLAAGIYSLFRGMKLKKSFGIQPKGAPVNFQKYENLSDGNYFEEVL